MNLSAIVLAGGLGTRLGHFTKSAQKVLAPVCGRPFILHLLDSLRRQLIKNVVLCVGYGGNQVEQLLLDGSKMQLSIQYSYDQPNDESTIGTFQAIRQALPLVGSRFFVLNGDTLLSLDYRKMDEFHRHRGCPATIAVCRNLGNFGEANIVLENQMVTFYSKKKKHPNMYHIDGGTGLFERSVFEDVVSHRDLSDLFTELSIAMNLAGFEVNERFYEINTAKSLFETEKYLKSQMINGNLNDIPQAKVIR